MISADDDWTSAVHGELTDAMYSMMTRISLAVSELALKSSISGPSRSVL
jgi:hypothetical protein